MEYLIVQDINGIYNLLNAYYLEDVKITPERKGDGAIVEVLRKGHFRRVKFHVSDVSKITASTLTDLTNKLK